MEYDPYNACSLASNQSPPMIAHETNNHRNEVSSPLQSPIALEAAETQLQPPQTRQLVSRSISPAPFLSTPSYISMCRPLERPHCLLSDEHGSLWQFPPLASMLQMVISARLLIPNANSAASSGYLSDLHDRLLQNFPNVHTPTHTRTIPATQQVDPESPEVKELEEFAMNTFKKHLCKTRLHPDKCRPSIGWNTLHWL